MKQQSKKNMKKEEEPKAQPATPVVNGPGNAITSSIASQIEQDAGTGMEVMGRDDYAIPRLVILQDLSPQVKKTESAFIQGASVGQICDPISETLFEGEDGIVVIPVSYRRAQIEWKPRTKGGGFVADHGSDGKILDQCTKNEKGRFVTKDGNEIVTTAEYFVFLVDMASGSYVPYVISMAGSQLKKSRRWNTMMNQLRVPAQNGGTFNPAMFYRSYKITTIPERNDQGSWFGWHVTPSTNTIDIPQGESLYIAARDFRKSIQEGKVTVAKPAEAPADGGSEPDDDAPM